MMQKRLVLASALLAALLVTLPTAFSSAYVQFELDTSTNGDFPVKVNNANPALTATFTNAGADTVTLVLDATNLVSSEFIPFWLFNYVGDPDADNLAFSPIGGAAELESVVLSASQSLNGGSQVKAGLFNVLLNFRTSNSQNRFTGSESLTLTITGDGLTETDFLLPSINGPENSGVGGWYTAARIQGIPGDKSGSIGTTSASVPEPASVAVWGLLGLVGLGCVHRRRSARRCRQVD
jgi:hypothetical protein